MKFIISICFLFLIINKGSAQILIRDDSGKYLIQKISTNFKNVQTPITDTSSCWFYTHLYSFEKNLFIDTFKSYKQSKIYFGVGAWEYKNYVSDKKFVPFYGYAHQNFSIDVFSEITLIKKIRIGVSYGVVKFKTDWKDITHYDQSATDLDTNKVVYCANKISTFIKLKIPINKIISLNCLVGLDLAFFRFQKFRYDWPEWKGLFPKYGYHYEKDSKNLFLIETGAGVELRNKKSIVTWSLDFKFLWSIQPSVYFPEEINPFGFSAIGISSYLTFDLTKFFSHSYYKSIKDFKTEFSEKHIRPEGCK